MHCRQQKIIHLKMKVKLITLLSDLKNPQLGAHW